MNTKDLPVESCPTCGGPVISPGITARRLGYRESFHCGILANQTGRNIKCWSLKRFGCYGLCDSRVPMCPIWIYYFDKPTRERQERLRKKREESERKT